MLRMEREATKGERHEKYQKKVLNKLCFAFFPFFLPAATLQDKDLGF